MTKSVREYQLKLWLVPDRDEVRYDDLVGLIQEPAMDSPLQYCASQEKPLRVGSVVTLIMDIPDDRETDNFVENRLRSFLKKNGWRIERR